MFAIAWGERLMGKVDRVPGRYHVATQCWMFCYLPLVPLGSYIVTQEIRRGMGAQFQGKRIPLSLKSLAVAWIRPVTGAIFSILAIAFATLVGLKFSGGVKLEPHAFRDTSGVTAIAGLLLLLPYWIPGIGRATAHRTVELDRVVSGA